MSTFNQPRTNFRSLGNNNFRNADNAPQPQPQQQAFGYNSNNREDEPVVAWLNLMVGGRNGEKKKLGKGIPLRDSNPLERAILNLIMDAEGNDLGFDSNILKEAITIDIRPAGQPDTEFEIDLFGVDTAPANPITAALQEEEAEIVPAPTPAQKAVQTRRRLTTK